VLKESSRWTKQRGSGEVVKDDARIELGTGGRRCTGARGARWSSMTFGSVASKLEEELVNSWGVE
jgi:hypothetical protein